MTSDISAHCPTEAVRTPWSRPEAVFLAAAAALLIGVFIPLPVMLLDILWVCVLSLTIAGVTIFPAAASTSDLKGFATLLSVPALLRIGLVGAIVQRVLNGESSGLMMAMIGGIATVLWPLAAALVCLVGSVLCVGALFGACQRISVAAERFLVHIRPLKCVGIETDLKTGIISTHQAHLLAEKVADESRLFDQLSGSAMLMRAEGAIEIAAMLVCLIRPFAGGAEEQGSGMARLVQASSAAIGLTGLSLIPAMLSAMAGAYLACKDTLTLRPAPSDSTSTGRTFTLVDQETGRSEEVELLNPDFVDHSRSEADDKAIEQLAEFEPRQRGPLLETLHISAVTASSYYRQLAGRVMDAMTVCPVVLFAARQIQHLPVTVFVNTAIQLARDGQKLLLVDADRRRNALARVFELDPETLNRDIQTTGLEGLDIRSLYSTAAANDILLQSARTYTGVLVYAPEQSAWESLFEVIGELEPSAFMFGPETEGPSSAEIAAAFGKCRCLYLTPGAPLPPQDS